MLDFLWSFIVFIGRAVNFVLDLCLFFSRSRRGAELVTGSDRIVDVPPDPKVLSPAAERALAEAETRQNSIASR